MIGAIWARVMMFEAPNVGKNIFIDDKSIRAKSRHDFELAFSKASEFENLCGQKLNMEKVIAFATNSTKVGWPRTWKSGEKR